MVATVLLVCPPGPVDGRRVRQREARHRFDRSARKEAAAARRLKLLIAGGKVRPLPTDGTISALNIPHSSIVFDLHQVTEIQAELLDCNGVATEQVKHANLVSFTCLKALAFEQRFERKDAHDLIYCIEHAPECLDVVSETFRLAHHAARLVACGARTEAISGEPEAHKKVEEIRRE